MPSFAKKRLMKKKFKKQLFSCFQGTKTVQTSGSVSSVCRKNRKVKKSISELELMKIVDCFLDGHGNYDSNLLPFSIKTLKQTKFFCYSCKNIQRIQNAK